MGTPRNTDVRFESSCDELHNTVSDIGKGECKKKIKKLRCELDFDIGALDCITKFLNDVTPCCRELFIEKIDTGFESELADEQKHPGRPANHTGSTGTGVHEDTGCLVVVEDGEFRGAWPTCANEERESMMIH